MEQAKRNRRRFLTASLAVGCPIGLGVVAWVRSTGGAPTRSAGTAAAFSPLSSLESVTRSAQALGCDVSLTVLHADRRVAEHATASALAELRLVEDLMSLYRPTSQLAVLNRDRAYRSPHPYLLGVLRSSQAMSKQTCGAFDVTVQPLWSLYAAAEKAQRIPDAEAVQEELSKVDWRRVELSPRQIRLRGQGTQITLNGIAQGFAADRAVAALRRWGVQHALVNTGEVGTLGAKPRGRPWTAGIQHPRRQDAFIALAKLQGRCLATSGDYATSFSRDHRCNHLFDPRTGRSPDAFCSVSVAAATALQADALSTAVFVLGLEEGLRLVRNTPAADAMLVLKDGRTFSTEGFPAEV